MLARNIRATQSGSRQDYSVILHGSEPESQAESHSDQLQQSVHPRTPHRRRCSDVADEPVARSHQETPSAVATAIQYDNLDGDRCERLSARGRETAPKQQQAVPVQEDGHDAQAAAEHGGQGRQDCGDVGSRRDDVMGSDRYEA